MSTWHSHRTQFGAGILPNSGRLPICCGTTLHLTIRARLRPANGKNRTDLPALRRGIPGSGIPGGAAQGIKWGRLREKVGWWGWVASGITLEAGGGGEEEGDGEEGGAASPNRHGRPARVGSGTDWRRKGRARAGLRGEDGVSGGGQYTRYWHSPRLRSLTKVHSHLLASVPYGCLPGP